MIRVLHHITEPVQALKQIRRVMQPGGTFILEFANKKNLKAIARYFLKLQDWNPFSPEPVEFLPLNFNFHPRSIHKLLQDAQFDLKRKLTVSHFRISSLKKLLPTRLLVALDSLAQFSGNWWQFTPSVFVQSIAEGRTETLPGQRTGFFQCPACGYALPENSEENLTCSNCQITYPIVEGIFDFRDQNNKSQ
jgi:uncharacterized protein YbaR (Trm112 family)